ncbi:helix-turn-helix transcriptional regulator [Pseudoxanthomonas mexicana]|jgi:transcriptional regulator with XRE-family HTH domain|uniref:helix-turn-helix transcriptional regulator n=1 Tax=Pseudoxanthomonas mexicana TaxID=128785 RepID=UPI0028A88B6D|nr:helix-turn-helix transcriptional regulator [Pseudoxanthomonas mexicana]
MDVQELLDAAKTAQKITTDKGLAEALGVTKQAVSNWRKGVSLPDTVTCATLAGYTGLPLAQVLGIVGEARAISREEKAVWRKLAGSVALVLCAIGISGAMPGKAYAVSVSETEQGSQNGSMPIM